MIVGSILKLEKLKAQTFFGISIFILNSRFHVLFSRELRLMDVLDNLCERMKLYRARPGPEFPYIKGGS